MSRRFGLSLGCFLLTIPLLQCAPAAPPKSQPATLVRPAFIPKGSPPAVVGKSAILIDAITGRVLAEKNADERRAVASTQKLMTALLVVDSGPLSDPVIVETSDTAVEPTKLYLKTGEVHTRGVLLKCILVRSANDAALALARDVGGSKEGFANMMNRRARSLGMMDSNFLNPHGLTEPGQYSTARDMAILARVAYQRSAIRGPMLLPQYRFVHSDGQARTLTATNKLLKRFPYATGMKTGTTNASGKCLVSSAEHNGRVAIAVVLGSTNAAVWGDSEKLLRWALDDPESQNTSAAPALR